MNSYRTWSYGKPSKTCFFTYLLILDSFSSWLQKKCTFYVQNQDDFRYDPRLRKVMYGFVILTQCSDALYF